MKVSESEEGYWTDQLQLYEHEQSFKLAIENAILEDAYEKASELLGDSYLSEAQNDLVIPELNTTFEGLPRGRYDANTWYASGATVLNVGGCRIPVEGIVHNARGRSNRLNRVTGISEIGGITNQTFAYENGAWIFGPVGENEGNGPTQIGAINFTQAQAKHYENVVGNLDLDIALRQVTASYGDLEKMRGAVNWMLYEGRRN